jgi:hypothetical protein
MRWKTIVISFIVGCCFTGVAFAQSASAPYGYAVLGYLTLDAQNEDYRQAVYYSYINIDHEKVFTYAKKTIDNFELGSIVKKQAWSLVNQTKEITITVNDNNLQEPTSTVKKTKSIIDSFKDFHEWFYWQISTEQAKEYIGKAGKDMEWEEITGGTFRLQVPGGWVIRYGNTGFIQVKMIFVPDRNHNWKIEKEKNDGHK